MIISLQALEQWLTLFVWTLARVSGFLAMFPVSSFYMPVVVRMLIAVVLSVTALATTPVAMLTSQTLNYSLDNSLLQGLTFTGLLITLGEFLTGMVFGMVLLLWLSLFTMAGHITGLQMGLGMAQMNDPTSGVNVTVVSQTYQLAALILFFLMDGHTTAITLLMESFRAIQPPAFPSMLASAQGVFSSVGWLFASALILALPAMTALLIINLAFGIISRTAPQLNFLSLGFPLTLLSGLLVLCFCIRQFPAPFHRFTQEALLLLRQLTIPG